MAINDPAEMGQLALAIHAHEAGANERAERILLDLLAGNPSAWEAQATLSLCLSAQHRSRDAVRAAEAAVAAAPEESLPHLALSRAYLEGDAIPEAAASCERALAIDPNGVSGWGLQAKVLNRQREYAKAVTAAQTGLAIKPTDLECLEEKSFAETMLGTPGAAGQTRAVLLSQEPDAPRSHLMSSIQSLFAGDVRQASVHSEELLRLWPGPGSRTLEWLVQCARIWMVGQIIACVPQMRVRRLLALMAGTVGGLCVVPWLFGAAILIFPEIYRSFPILPGVCVTAFLVLRLQEPARTLYLFLRQQGEVIPTSFRRTLRRTIWGIPWWVAASAAWAFSGADRPWLAALSTGLVVLPISSIATFNSRGTRWFCRSLDGCVALHGIVLLLCLYRGWEAPVGFMEAAYTANVILVQAFVLACHLFDMLCSLVDARSLLETYNEDRSSVTDEAASGIH